MRKPRILVVGSFVMDHIAATRVFPREGQTVLGESFSKAPGGKGANQAVQAARLGADVTMIGKLGQDSNGDELLRVCRAAGVNVDQVIRDEAAASGCCVIILEQKDSGQTQNRIIVIPGANKELRREELAYLKEEIAAYDLVMLQLEIPMEINEMVARFAWEKGVPVMLNPAPSAPLSPELLSHLAYLSPNEHEAAELSGAAISRSGGEIDREQVRRASEALRSSGVQRVLITLGESGAALAGEGEWVHAPSVKGVTAVDPTAAGDSFVAAFCVGACCGWDWDTVLRFANSTAAITVSRLGAMPSLPTLAEVEAFLRERGDSLPDTSPLK